jgi:hypothetical protein
MIAPIPAQCATRRVDRYDGPHGIALDARHSRQAAHGIAADAGKRSGAGLSMAQTKAGLPIRFALVQ